MDNFSINGQAIIIQGVKELDPALSIQEAAQKTKKNGLDEVYFTQDGKNYVVYGDKMDLSQLEKSPIPAISLNGKQATFVTFEDEKNSLGDGIKKGALDGLKTARNIVNAGTGVTMKSIGPASIVLAGGAIVLTGIVLAKGGITSVATSPLSKILGDVIVRGSANALKGVAIAGALGLGISVVTGSVVGAAESLSTEKDYSTIASVSKEGNFKLIHVKPEDPPKDEHSPPTREEKKISSGEITIKSKK